MRLLSALVVMVAIFTVGGTAFGVPGMTVGVHLSAGEGPVRHPAEALSCDQATPTPAQSGTPSPAPTPQPTTSPAPSLEAITFCNGTPQPADGLEAILVAPVPGLQAQLTQNAPGCPIPSVTAERTAGPDFTFNVALTWPAACVDPSESVAIAFSCGTWNCVPSLHCVGWSLAGEPIEPPCAPPTCGSVACCEGVPCPTAAPGTDADGDGVPDASDNCPTVPNPDQASTKHSKFGDACNSVPGDVNCDFRVDAIDALLVLRYVAAIGPAAQCVSLYGYAHCDPGLNTVDATDALWILRYVAGLETHLGCGK